MLPPVRTDTSHSPGRFRVGAVALSALPLLVGCARMLGIDGEYVSGEHATSLYSGGAGAIDQDAWSFPTALRTGGASGNASGGTSAGGFIVGNGGIPVGVLMTGGATGNVPPPPASGGACSNCPPSAVMSCPFGTYSGSVSGQHSASILAGFRLPVSGTVTFTLQPDPSGPNAIVSGKIDGSATIGPNSFANFGATLSGSFNCADSSMKGSIDGTYAIAAGAPPVPFSGSHEGTFANATFEGSWTEHEVSNATMNQYFGTGKWTAAAVGP